MLVIVCHVTHLCMSVTGRRHESGDAVLVCYRYVRPLLEQQVYDTHVSRGACLLDTTRATISGIKTFVQRIAE